MAYEGGFQGRSNKLVDGCYSFWIGSAIAVLDLGMGGGGGSGDGDGENRVGRASDETEEGGEENGLESTNSGIPGVLTGHNFDSDWHITMVSTIVPHLLCPSILLLLYPYQIHRFTSASFLNPFLPFPSSKSLLQTIDCNTLLLWSSSTKTSASTTSSENGNDNNNNNPVLVDKRPHEQRTESPRKARGVNHPFQHLYRHDSPVFDDRHLSPRHRLLHQPEEDDDDDDDSSMSSKSLKDEGNNNNKKVDQRRQFRPNVGILER